MEGVYEQKIFSFPKSDFRAQTNGDWSENAQNL